MLYYIGLSTVLSLIILDRSEEAYEYLGKGTLSRGKEGKGPDMLGVFEEQLSSHCG